VDAEAVRRASGAAAGSLDNAASIVFALPADSVELISAIVEGAVLGDYAFTTYKSQDTHSSPAEVVIVTDLARSKAAMQALATAEIVSPPGWLRLGPSATPGTALLPAAPCEGASGAGRQGHHNRLGRAVPEGQGRHDHDEARHGRRGGRCGGDQRHRGAEAADQGSLPTPAWPRTSPPDQRCALGTSS
jgi:hypothetical protein